MNTPIFVVGVPRSGTTLLRVMLDSHPAIACGPEFPLLTQNVANIWGRDWPCTESFSTGIPLRIFTNFGFSASDVHSFCATFVDVIFSEYARRRNKDRWAIKVPRLVEKIDYLSQLFPQASFLHVIRDGRDAVSSSLGQQQVHADWYPGHTAETFAKDWVGMIAKARADSKRVAKYYELHYEDLVLKPRATMEGVMSFLQEVWADSVLEHHRSQHDFSDRELSTRAAQKPLYANSIGGWRRNVTDEVLSAIMAVDGFATLLQKENYLTAAQPRAAADGASDNARRG